MKDLLVGYEHTTEFRLTHNDQEIIVKTNQHHLEQILDAFEAFLKACGFTIDGHLDIVSDD